MASRRSWVLTLVALVAAGVLFFAVVVPPAPERVDVAAWRDLAAVEPAGAYHIHTTRSDGAGDTAAVAAAARRAGLQFVIVTDHGDGTRPPDPPAYRDGVLCLDGVEISTDNGHYVAIDMPRTPYPLGGAGDAVIEDVHRLGGFGIIAHPDSPKASLRWTGSYDGVGGIEWLNADSEWRRDSRAALARAGVSYVLRPGPALASLFDRPSTLDRWDRLTSTRQVVALAAVDAHGGVRASSVDGRDAPAWLPGIPSYEASFKTITNRVVLDAPLTGDAASDAHAIYRAIRAGRVFTAIDAIASPAFLDFHLESPSGSVRMGGKISTAEGSTLVARAPMPRGSVMVLLRDGREVARSAGTPIRFATEGAPGSYRVEIHAPRAPGHPPVPWVVSNPIYVGLRPAPVALPLAEAPLPGTQASLPWRIEKDPSSRAALRPTPNGVELDYTLGGGPRASQYVALASDARLDPGSTIRLALSSDAPMRVSVQVRDANGVRWGRSYYVDPDGTALAVAVGDLRAIGQGSAPLDLDPRTIRSLLLVVDLTNAPPGHSGILRVGGSEIVR